MATLLIENVPDETLVRLRERAAAHNRTVREEVLAALGGSAAPPVADCLGDPVPSDEVSAPFDLEVPGPSEVIHPRDAGAPRLELWFDEDRGAE